MQPEERLINQRVQKLKELKELGQNPYAHEFIKTHYAKEIVESNKGLKKEERTNKKAKIAGRIISLRVMGKASFGHILDCTGKIQFYIREDDVKEDYKVFRKFDIGDIVGIEGTIFRTRLGEVTIWVKKIRLLTKSLRSLPEKWHGLKDQELRYRQRYVDLIVNSEVKEVFEIRRRIIYAIREFMVKNGFVEVETPILQPIYGGTNAKPFKSYLNALNMDVYLRVSNELYLKRLIVGGYEKIFEFSTDFRNEGVDKLHSPEFTQVETMFGYVSYKANMDFSEDLISYVAKKVLGKTKIRIENNLIDLKKPWKRISFAQCIKKYLDVDFDSITSLDIALAIANKKNVDTKDCNSVNKVLIKLFEEQVQPKLIQPTLVFDYPRDEYGLAKISEKDQRFVEAFEIIINGWEMGLSYSEQNDPEILKQIWKKAEDDFKKGNQEAQRTDKDFLLALEYGMPPTSGLGIGIDRLTRLLTNSNSLRDVILFPFMKPI